MMSVLVLGGYILVSTLLAVTSGNQPSSLGSGYSPELMYYSINCDPSLDSECDSSLSLKQIASKVAENLLDLHSIQIYINISIPQLLLKANVTYVGLNSLTLSGDTRSNTTIICTNSSFAGLTFQNIRKLELRHFTVINCGARFHEKVSTYSSAIVICQGRNVIVKNLILMNNTGIGMAIVDHKGGYVLIESSKYIRNSLPEYYYSGLNIKGGGGLYIGDFKQNPLEPITFHVVNCTFERNTAHTRYYDFLYTDDLGQPINGHGQGGGAAILLERGLTDIHTIFSGCTFRENEAFKGGGLMSEIEGARDSATRNISVSIEHSLFERNGCSSSNLTASGGGISLNFAVRNRTNFDSNKFLLYNVTLNKNCAEFGGGLYFYSEYLENAALMNTLDIDRCIFTGNRAHTGSAVDITPSVFERLLNGILTTPVFRYCTFSNNTVIINFQVNRTQTTYGIGTIYVSLFNIRFEGHNIFENNLGTPVHIVNGNIDMSHSSVDIIGNTGIRGGAIALIGVSSITIGQDRTYTFVKNVALDRGGALYVEVFDNHDITASKTCFIQYFDANSYYLPAREWNATVIFRENRAETDVGHTIFTTSLYPCQIINIGNTSNYHLESIDPSHVFTVRKIIIEQNSTVEGEQIATEGAILLNNAMFPLEVIPGEQFAHGVTIRDDLHHKAKVVLSATLPNNKNVKIDTAFSACVGEKLVLKGKPGQHASLYIHTTTSRLSYVRLSIKLIDCPPGFIYNEISSKCICVSQAYTGLLRCNTPVFYSYITAGFWIGMLCDAKNKSKMELVTSYCPQHFCNYNMTTSVKLTIQLPRHHSHLTEALCGKSRTGVACGRCASGYTTYFHSPSYRCSVADSVLCKFGWLFYILSELMPVTAVFILVITLNISFSTGSVHGFILYSQLLSSLNIDASGVIALPPAVTKLSEAYRLLYGFFNLEFFQIEPLSFCIWPNATALDVLAFKYVTVVYALLLVIAVVWFMNKCGGRCLGKWFRITTVKSSVIHGISAFLILCYSQCVRVSLKLLNAYTPFVRENSSLTVSKRVWLNGNIEFFSRYHLAYAVPAILCLLLVGAVPPLLLIAYPLSNKIFALLGIEESKLVTFISQKLRFNRLKPQLDSFQGSFKDNMRFFAGVYFLYRWIILIFTTIFTDFNNIYTAVEIFFVIILVLHALCQPYSSKVHNMVDALLFGNLALINAISFAHYSKFHTVAGKQAATNYIIGSATIQLVLICLPLVIMTVYVFTRVCQAACTKLNKNNDDWTKNSIVLRKLRSSFSKETDDDDELPHRLIADDVDLIYESFVDDNHASYNKMTLF